MVMILSLLLLISGTIVAEKQLPACGSADHMYQLITLIDSGSQQERQEFARGCRARVKTAVDNVFGATYRPESLPALYTAIEEVARCRDAASLLTAKPGADLPFMFYRPLWEYLAPFVGLDDVEGDSLAPDADVIEAVKAWKKAYEAGTLEAFYKERQVGNYAHDEDLDGLGNDELEGEELEDDADFAHEEL